MLEKSKKKLQGQSDWIWLCLLLIGNAIFLRWNAFRVFSFFDMSQFMDGAWRVLTGQKPYSDFFFWSGPLHLYLFAFFYYLFGFGKWAVLGYLVFLNSLVMITTFILLRGRVKPWQTWMITALSATSFCWPASFPLYDHLAHVFGIFTLVILYVSVFNGAAKGTFWLGLVCGVLSVFSIMTKTNIGACYFLVSFFAILFFQHRTKGVVGFFVGAALALAGLLCAIGNVREFYYQTFLTYQRASGGRFGSLFNIRIWLINFFWLPFLIVTGNNLLHWNKLKTIWYPYFLFMGSIFISVFSYVTSSMIMTANFSLWGICMALALLTVSETNRDCPLTAHALWHRSVIFLLMTTVAGMLLISAVKGVRLTVWRLTAQSPVGDYAIQAKPLQGWKTDRETGEALDQLVVFVRERIPKSDSLLVLAGLQILYPLTDRMSYRGIPMCFTTAYTSMGEIESIRRTKERILKDPPDWIITQHKPFSAANPLSLLANNLVDHFGLQDFLTSFYQQVYEAGPFAVLKKILK